MRLFATSLSSLLCFHGVLGAPRRAAPRCVESLLSSGTFLIQATFCEPIVRNASRANTLLIMSPGATYDSVYWDIQFEPERYSFVRFAAAQGFATLNLARLGNGRSAHPDPLNVVQTPLQAAIQVEILKLAREGRITGSSGRRFRTLVGIGHSLSSFLLNGVIADAAPGQLQAAIFSGYSHTGPGVSSNLTEVVGLLPARQVVPARFRGLASGFLTSHNESTRVVFYGPAGTFDPRALAFDEATKDLVSTGEIGTRGATVGAAPQFRGDVLTINGANDQFFCDSTACTNIVGEAQFYPNAKSVESAVIQNSGHSLNFHLAAPDFFATMLDWLTRHGF
ncbi:hypothetical protein AURDEDRAFT_134843 [Auricularia subglabra TFB-10046 SS5]|nr:hypothetical protein AURDEDRAFT_134843 [Auricularia subglabra TFB-10046 SS5]